MPADPYPPLSPGALAPPVSSASSVSSAFSVSSASSVSSAVRSPGVSFAYRPTRTLHLAAAIDGGEQFEAEYYVELARLAERGALDFVTLDFPVPDFPAADARVSREARVPRAFREAGEARDVQDFLSPDGGCLDALGVLARVAPATDRIGVVPTVVAAAHGDDPFGLALAVATLDWVSRGRAGWTVTVRPRQADGTPVRTATARRRAAERAAERWRATGEIAEAVAAVWDGAGAAAARAPQGRPITAVDATEPAARATAARHADIAFVRAARPEPAARIREELRLLAAEAGRDPDRLLVLAELSVDLGGGELGPEPGAEIALVPDGLGGMLFSGGPVDLAELVADWHYSGAVDGFHVRPVEPRRDLERFVNGTVALLQHRGLFRSFHPGATLREHLGLHRPANRLAVTGGAAS